MSHQTNSELSRREFLKRFGAGAAALVATQLLATQQANASDTEGEPETWGVLIDLTRCVGCNSCVLACKEANNLQTDSEMPTGLSSDTYTFLDVREITTANGEIESRTVKRQCMHCVDPACVSACPAAAMYKSEAGPVVYRAERCLGCRYCQIACPFGVPSFEWNNGVTPVISKCWMCLDRLHDGQQPACVSACPTGALRVGKREALLAQARAQIESNPGRYINHIYGEHEVGGTSMLYLSDIPFEELGFPTLPHTAPPKETEKIMRTLPTVITSTAALMAGVALYTHRK
jgi:formate dehydrogenase iron-sulfur subunit